MPDQIIVVPPDSSGKKVDVSELTVGANTVERQRIVIADPIAAASLSTVAQFHNADNQALAATAYGLLTGGVTQLLNAAGNIDRLRETGQDGIAAVGVQAGAASFAMAFRTTDSTDNFAAGTRTFTPAAMSGTAMGVSWSIQVGSVLVLDSGASVETVVVTAVTATTFTCVTAKAHNGTVTAFPITGFVFNQERDAAGELDGATGSGTAIAAEYEYNGGGAGTGVSANSSNNFDRSRNLQGKGRGTGTVSSGGGIGSTSVTLTSAPTGLQPGSPVVFDKLGATPEVAYTAFSYAAGANPIVLQTALIAAHAAGTVDWDIYTPLGPGTSGFLPTGVGIEEEALWDPVSGLYYLERAATQDGVSQNNVVMENPGLWNGTAIDRGRSTSAANLGAQSGVGAEMTAPPGMWSINNVPAAATQATITRAAGGAGVRHVCTSISATLAAGATAQAAAVSINLRDGATGAGTVLWSKQVILPANGVWEVSISGLNIPGSAATAMTLEFSAAGAAGTFESVSLTGYDAS